MNRPREIKCECGFVGVAATNEGGAQWCPRCEMNSKFVHLVEAAPVKARIAELEDLLNIKNDEYVQQVGSWKIIQRLDEQVKKLESKLALAVEALVTINKFHETEFQSACTAKTALDNIKGESE